MPAKVIVQSGISAGTSHWIERPVIRIGSDPQSDICLPSADIPSHALTLEFREGLYRVYNRSRSDVFVGPQIVSPGQVFPWSHAESLQLEGVGLVLDVESDPTPQPMQATMAVAADLEEELQQTFSTATVGEESAAGEIPKKPSRILEMVVIALCVLGGIGLLARENMKGTSRPDRPVFSKVVRNAIDSPNTSPQLIQRLQYAESAVIRGNKKSARKRFGGLRDDLVRQKNRFVANQREPELEILDFVEYRLGQLD